MPGSASDQLIATQLIHARVRPVVRRRAVRGEEDVWILSWGLGVDSKEQHGSIRVEISTLVQSRLFSGHNQLERCITDCFFKLEAYRIARKPLRKPRFS